MSMTTSSTVPGPAGVEPDPALRPADPAEVLRRQVYMGFSASVAVGLALAGLYIGGRVFANATLPREPLVVATVVRPVPQVVAPKPSPLQRAVPAPVTATAGRSLVASAPALGATVPAVPTLINPQAGERYLQLAAFGPGCTNLYMKELEAKGIHALVAPGPSETIYRVVLGPFADRSETKRQQEALEAAGIQSMERVY
jgi:cell division septation protein DedD